MKKAASTFLTAEAVSGNTSVTALVRRLMHAALKKTKKNKTSLSQKKKGLKVRNTPSPLNFLEKIFEDSSYKTTFQRNHSPLRNR